MFVNTLVEGKIPVKVLIDTTSKYNTISKHLFDKLESDHGLEGIVGDDLIGKEIKGLDLQFHIKRKWQSLDDTELIDFQIYKNPSFDLLFDEDFNKASSTKNNLSKSTESKPGLAQEESKNNVKYSTDASSNSDTSESDSSNSSTSSSEIEVTHAHKTRAVKKCPILKRKISSINVSEIAPFLAFVLIMMFAEKIPVHLIFVAMCSVTYVVRQQLTAELDACMKRLTTDLTSREATIVVEGQRILTIVNTVIETINEITTNYESLRDQLDQITETGSVAPLISEQFAGPSVSTSKFSQRSSGSSLGSSSGSSQLSFSDITSTTRNHFKILFDKIMIDNNYSLDDMCNMVSVEIHSLGIGKIGKETIKNFYYNNGDFRGSTLNKIGAWIDSKNNFNLANNTE
ncbi:10150_t:CDS:2 [Dentiscutata heterogama]|uniref:10150_t:CDS:1 n=1 Tax=Dentiscutata heterogama TaxID=1316150 RepID=A0ACA9K197_9GLOM|nr:10150_t:CDS:2 [Dentiscutata heterogama]